MGLMAVGTVAFVEPSGAEEDDESVDPSLVLDEVSDAPDMFANVQIPEDNFDPDYDSRGGDDAAILEPYSLSDADRVTLSDGTEEDDTLAGDEGNDRIRGLEGADTLTGGAGNDELRGDGGDDVMDGETGNDTLHGMDGGDQIVLGDWLASGETAQILDYASEDDSLVLVWDDSAIGSVEPQITLIADPDTFNQTLILMDGTVVATVNGSDLLPGDIALMPFSTASLVGLAQG
jgi:Ca2+-binding RTX toxin-like protein